MSYAINVYDLLKFKDNLPVMLLTRGIFETDPAQIVPAEGKSRPDGDAARLTCDEARAAAIVGFLRRKIPIHALRCYYSKSGRGGWKRI